MSGMSGSQKCAIRPWVIILAAGLGSRIQNALDGERKQFVKYRGAPLYWQSARVMARAGLPGGIVFVFPPELLEEERSRISRLDMGAELGIPWLCAAGGARRRDSVRNALAALPAWIGHVLVHDAARPFPSAALVRRICVELGQGARAVIPAITVSDTIKQVENGRVLATPARDSLMAVQTPQGFDARLLAMAHDAAIGAEVTDDATLMEMAGHCVKVVDGERGNVKITNPEDLDFLHDRTARKPVCAMGYDVHRYGSGHPMRLGGVEIAGEVGIIAHSDGDVLLHALIDALLAAGSLGDIGSHFPDSDSRYAGISSAILLDHALELLRPVGLEISHVDLTVAAQKPRLAPHANAIRCNVARLLGIAPEDVSFKATTEEGMGFTGRGEGVRAWALVSASRH